MISAVVGGYAVVALQRLRALLEELPVGVAVVDDEVGRVEGLVALGCTDTKVHLGGIVRLVGTARHKYCETPCPRARHEPAQVGGIVFLLGVG